jgi:hypothetical protein
MGAEIRGGGMSFHFNKRAKAPLRYHLLRHLGEIVDAITGLIMLPFGRYGTQFNAIVCEKTLLWQRDAWRSRRGKTDAVLHSRNVGGKSTGGS